METMTKTMLGFAILFLGSRGAYAQCKVPTDGIYIMDTDVKEVLKGAPPAVDQQLRVVLNGPFCSCQMVGNVTKRVVGPGDIIIIPFGVPHGWMDITDHVDYLNVRPDPDHVLQTGYVNPGVKQ